ncbi:hypothetical protein AB0E56_18815, partial [Microbacterium sp. NPDC028030]|uniref:hypothetical protein n=1 Tax=Microbacterium sp. NPDC028030 TaxID=3155124 RepID=UPI0033DBE569
MWIMDSIVGNDAEDNPALWSRRSVLRMLVIAGVLPPVLGSQTGTAAAAATQLTTTGGGYADALRRLDKPNLVFTQIAQLVGQSHRMTFFQASWDGGGTIVGGRGGGAAGGGVGGPPPPPRGRGA